VGQNRSELTPVIVSELFQDASWEGEGFAAAFAPRSTFELDQSMLLGPQQGEQPLVRITRRRCSSQA
jgi:hypothetical protein